MKRQLGIVIKNDGNSAKVKIINNQQKVKIVEATNKEGAIVGESVYVEFNTLVKLKLIYIKFIQPIVLALLGILAGKLVGAYLHQPDFIYKCVCICVFVTIALIYKDYNIEKNKLSLKYNPTIKKID